MSEANHPSRNIRPETTPLYTTSVYTFPNLDTVRNYYDDPETAYLYRRNSNPNGDAVERILSDLEGTEDTVLCASGMAAISQGCFALLSPGDHVIATRLLYGGTYAFFEQVLRPWGVDVEYVDLENPETLTKRIGKTTRLIYVETIANPLLQVADLEAIGRVAADYGIPWMVDNTFATPLLAKPSLHGATIVVNSLTKYLNGHSDVIGGACSGSRETIRRVRAFAVTFGGVLSPYDAWMTERGLKTFALRVRAQCTNAHQIASALEKSEFVTRVYYPGLPSHATYNTADRTLNSGFGAMVSFELPGGETQVNRFVAACQRIPFAPSLGGVKTTLSHPGLTSHRAYTAEEREKLNITDGLVRLSVGTEDSELILTDLLQAIKASSVDC